MVLGDPTDDQTCTLRLSGEVVEVTGTVWMSLAMLIAGPGFHFGLFPNRRPVVCLLPSV
jgi:hypothetical protein